jgi:hypothetical protein
MTRRLFNGLVVVVLVSCALSLAFLSGRCGAGFSLRLGRFEVLAQPEVVGLIVHRADGAILNYIAIPFVWIPLILACLDTIWLRSFQRWSLVSR